MNSTTENEKGVMQLRTVDLIRKKRDGGELSAEELRFLIEGYCRGDIPDYQMAAWAMAVYFRGMSPAETADLTLIMAESGDRMDLGAIGGIKVDKHSTGGVGDKTTIALAPLVAAAGVPVAKMSGRGLGHTGGTIDKLESIPGFRVEMAADRFIDQVNQHGIAVISQSGNITPADKKLYSLRDVTATVNSIPLIASSVMSKKIASGADGIVLDVKMGGGAFMKTWEEAAQLAQAMVDIGLRVGRETVALITGMDEPLGYAVGNALEVREAIDLLKGDGPADLKELCLALGAQMLVLGGRASTAEQARTALEELIASGKALKKLKEFIAAQGANPTIVDRPELLPRARWQIAVKAQASGYVTRIAAEEIGLAAMRLGAGRATKDSGIDLSVGVILRKKIGDAVAEGDLLAELHAGEAGAERLEPIQRQVREAFEIGADAVMPPRLIHALVDRKGIHRL
jgi:pyrimidine-nucleoside phosphorylase